jgi:general secretion pathway protein D
VDADIFSRLGVQWSTGPAGDTSTFAAGLGLGFIHKGSLTALVTALSGDNNTNILSTPSITVLNNGNASITVGSSVSVITNALTQPAANTSTTSVVTNSYNYKDVGLTLNVVPQITSDDSVNMKISQSNSTLLSKAASAGIVNGNTNPDMNTQSLSTTILVKNEDILVLGGLTQNKEEVHVTKIPILSAIPLLGKLFQYEEKRMVKKDLLIFLRPMILNNAQDGTLVTNNKYNMMRNTAVATLHGNTLKDTSILPDPIHQVLPEPFS